MAAEARVRVWDGPVRIVHWLIALAVPALWWTGEHDQLDWHRRIGYGVLGLLLFRLIWGFVGGSTARFAGFIRGPRTVAGYASRLFRGEKAAVVGHNPMGGWSVAALLALVLAEVGLGLFAVDVDGLEPGPLSRFVDFDAGRAAAQWHAWVFYAFLAMIGLHLAAIVFYAAVKRDNLVGPMLTGRRTAVEGAAPMAAAPLWRALVAAAVATALAVWIARGLR
ncbi:MAG: cytochrome b/b6 domain-containing protein [Caulobacteraceae bacterium]|nr:cytochrome b/b6 domain-containing protein [Caulobacteraceae bacterium]